MKNNLIRYSAQELNLNSTMRNRMGMLGHGAKDNSSIHCCYTKQVMDEQWDHYHYQLSDETADAYGRREMYRLQDFSHILQGT
jgi:hypothetical protein